jgi:Na+-transporting methylmalonyl-CoA/oxaloacetate decarboxylase gamma subunit
MSGSSRGSAITIRVVTWLGFGVVLGLLPLLVDAVKVAMSPTGFDLTKVLGGGGLFIAGAVLAGGAIGELISAGISHDFSGARLASKIMAVVLCVAVVLALVVNTVGYSIGSDASTIRHLSILFFISSVIPSGLILAMVTTE